MAFVGERFHEYLYEPKFKVINDWKQVKSIHEKKYTVNFPSCIQTLFLLLQKYDLDLKYSPGNTMLLLDALSPCYIKNLKPKFDEKSFIHHVHFVISNRPISKEHLKQFKMEP